MIGYKIKVGAKYPNFGTVVLSLRMISLVEEKNYNSRFGEIKSTETLEKISDLEYAILTDALSSWSEEWPLFIDEKGKESKLTEDADTPADAVKKYFSEKTAIKERLANRLMVGYRSQLIPDLVFPSASS